jgi:hypothetical protein
MYHMHNTNAWLSILSHNYYGQTKRFVVSKNQQLQYHFKHVSMLNPISDSKPLRNNIVLSPAKRCDASCCLRGFIALLIRDVFRNLFSASFYAV